MNVLGDSTAAKAIAVDVAEAEADAVIEVVTVTETELVSRDVTVIEMEDDTVTDVELTAVGVKA